MDDFEKYKANYSAFLKYTDPNAKMNELIGKVDEIENKMVEHKREDEIRQRQQEARQFRHDWRIAAFSSYTGLLTGAASGVIASIIYNILIKPK